MIKVASLAASLVLLASCAADRVGWGPRGRFWRLHDTLTLQVRRGPQVLDPGRGEIAITWLGARTPEEQPPLLACALTVFDDRNGNGALDPGEILCTRESLERTSKVLFDDVRVRGEPVGRLRARLVARTERELLDVSWRLVPD